MKKTELLEEEHWIWKTWQHVCHIMSIWVGILQNNTHCFHANSIRNNLLIFTSRCLQNKQNVRILNMYVVKQKSENNNIKKGKKPVVVEPTFV